MSKKQSIPVSQIQHREQGMQNKDILPLKEVFPRTTTHALLTNELYTNLQRAVSSPEYFYKGNPERFEKGNKKVNKEIYDTLLHYLVVDTNRIPPRFLELFDREEEHGAAAFREIFARARFPFKPESYRIIFIDDKIVIFRNNEILTHTQKVKKLTQGEKKRSEIKTTFNTFATLYDAVRSQYHTLDTEYENQQDYTAYQNEVLALMQEIKTHGKEHIKDASFHRRIEDLIQETKKAQNSKILAACLYNFQQLTFTNSSLDSNHLRGTNNKLRDRFAALFKIIGIIKKQLTVLETLLKEHEMILDMYITQMKFANLDLAFENYSKIYQKLHHTYGDVAPFSTYYHLIDKYRKTNLQDKSLQLIQFTFNAFKAEHQQKLSATEKKFLDSDFEDVQIMKDNLSLLDTLIKQA